MEKFIILTPKEIQQLYNYSNNYEGNVVILSFTIGIGDAIKLAQQNEWCNNKDCEQEDITDYDSW